MNGMNKVFLLGFVGSNPVQLTSKTGQRYTRFNLATHRHRTGNGSGKGVDHRHTDWHTIFVWGQRGDFCAEHLRKGASILVEGSIATFDIPDPDGGKKQKFAITAFDVELISSPKPKAQASAEPEERPVLTATS